VVSAIDERAGYYTVIIDLFNGDAMSLNTPAGFDFMDWMTNGTTGNNPHTFQAVDPIVEAGIKYLKKEKGFKKVGGVGYCFGAKYVARFLKEQGLDVGYCAHPVSYP
jgi:dienelactone hydrolase